MIRLVDSRHNAGGELTRRSQHLSPDSLAQELASMPLGKRYPIYITHTKPVETDLIMAEIARFNGCGEPGQTGATSHYDIHWLRAGQVFEV